MKVFTGISSYLNGVLAEMRKVVWPTLPQLTRYIVSVVAGLLLATIFVGGTDYLFVNYLLPLFIKS